MFSSVSTKENNGKSMTQNAEEYYATGEKNRLCDFLKVNEKRIRKLNHLIHINIDRRTLAGREVTSLLACDACARK